MIQAVLPKSFSKFFSAVGESPAASSRCPLWGHSPQVGKGVPEPYLLEIKILKHLKDKQECTHVSLQTRVGDGMEKVVKCVDMQAHHILFVRVFCVCVCEL